jgi:hypothetical protein
MNLENSRGRLKGVAGLPAVPMVLDRKNNVDFMT